MNSHVKRIKIIQNKAIRIINFSGNRTSSSPLYKISNILKFEDQITLENFLFVHDSLKKKTPIPLQERFNLIRNTHRFNVRISAKNCVQIPPARTNEFGIHSILGRAARNWNHFQILMQNENLYSISRNQCKKKIKDYFLNNY